MENFITDLYRLAVLCEYGSLKQNRLVVGLRNDNFSEKQQTNSDLTLGQAVQQARQSENVKKTRRSYPIATGSSKRGERQSFKVVEI